MKVKNYLNKEKHIKIENVSHFIIIKSILISLLEKIYIIRSAVLPFSGFWLIGLQAISNHE